MKTQLILLCAMTSAVFTSINASAQTANEMTKQDWSLHDAVKRAMEISPQLKASMAYLKAQKANARQAGRLSNPVIQTRYDDRLKKAGVERSGGITEVALSQSLPLAGKLRRQKAIARVKVKLANVLVKQRQLKLEHQTAKLFHQLQAAQARLVVSKDQLRSSGEFQRIGRQREKAGDLSKLKRLRLDLAREQAHQNIKVFSNQLANNRARFYLWLRIDSPPVGNIKAFIGSVEMPALSVLITGLDRHPEYLAGVLSTEMAQQGVGLAKANRWGEIELKVFQAREEFSGVQEDVTGVGVSVPLPLWNRAKSNVQKASALASQADYDLEGLKIKLETQLKLDYARLRQLIDETQHYKAHVLRPAKTVFRLARISFKAGEADILILLDASKAYFEAKKKYADLKRDRWLQAAKLRYASGGILYKY